ncbi:MAG: hypothetical protein H0W15_02180 [Gemmatimonadales bacterium]|nr:hypothetical protein [Gemmatimonadales bacterium]
MRRNGAMVAALVLAAAPLAAQSTGTPVYAAPYRAFSNSEIGVSFSDPGPGFALEGSYRIGFGPTIDGGVRGGLADGKGRNAALLVGVDGRARVLDHSEAFPVDGSFTFGFGISSSGGNTVAMLPIGFTMGRRILVDGSNLTLVPYVHPVLTPLFGDADGIDLSIGFGVDLRLTPRLDLRFSAAIGDRDGIGFTVAFLR